MNTPSRRKRANIALVILLTTAMAVAIWSGLIQRQRAALRIKAKLVVETKAKVNAANRSLGLSDAVKANLTSVQQKLATMESKMATGDVYRWAIRAFGKFRTNDVEIVNLDPPRLGEPGILPKIPYNAATFSISGKAYYHTFGEFLANLENSYPHLRLQRLDLEAAHFGETDSDEQEKLNFKIEILALVKGTVTDL